MRKTIPLPISSAELERLNSFINSGTAKARHIKHANVLKKLAEGWSYERIAQAFELDRRTVIRLKQRYQAEGLEAVLRDKPRSGAPKRFGGEVKAVVVATACTTPPAGHEHWTLRLLAERLVELEVVEAISHISVGRILKKTN